VFSQIFIFHINEKRYQKPSCLLIVPHNQKGLPSENTNKKHLQVGGSEFSKGINGFLMNLCFI